MKIKVDRKHLKTTYTIGDLYIDNGNGYEWFCNTLEDTVRDYDKDGILDVPKIYGKTAIPYGEYIVKLGYSPKFKRIMPRVQNVKGFEGILIHMGNTDDDSSGCILVGVNEEKGRIDHSLITFEKLMHLLNIASNEITLKIV